jgi:hypothetical protein
MNAPLKQFQDDFICALYGAGDAIPHLASLSGQPGFAVYRNTVIKGCIDTLAANFPTVQRLVGEQWFRSAALEYARATPPSAVSMMTYGDNFPQFLAQFPPAAELPYLADVARLDRFWIAAHTAADDIRLDAAVLGALAPQALAQTVLRPRASTHWQWFAQCPAYTIWSVNRAQQEMPGDLAWIAEGALLTRREGVVCWQPLDLGGCELLNACAAGLPLEAAVSRAAQADPAQDIARTLADLLAAGAFAAA